jgi:hypothetical protein
LLFPGLYELLASQRSDGKFRAWGVPRGHKSSDANKWSKVSPSDIAVFTRIGKTIGFSEIDNKFQSESIARKLWPNMLDEQTKQYIFVLKEYFEIDDLKSNLVESIRRKAKLDLSTFAVLDNNFTLEILNALGFKQSEINDKVSPQGFGLSSTEKKIVELHAVNAAINYLTELGFTRIDDVGDRESYDLLASDADRQIYVEVKGTTGSAKTVILTKNEVAIQRVKFPFNGLFILSNIELDRGEVTIASGGEKLFISPWSINDTNLEAISYEYTVGDGDEG